MLQAVPPAAPVHRQYAGRAPAVPRYRANTPQISTSHCSHVLASADAFLSSACHCEPVRTLVRQSVSPQRNSANWLLFGQIRCALPIRPKYCFPSCSAARRTDCHVASLLAMTKGEGVIAPRVLAHADARQISAHLACQTSLHSLTPGKFLRTLRATSLQAQTPFCLLHVIAHQCAHWCGNPRPRRETWQVSST